VAVGTCVPRRTRLRIHAARRAVRSDADAGREQQGSRNIGTMAALTHSPAGAAPLAEHANARHHPTVYVVRISERMSAIDLRAANSPFHSW
jgi:hypothetical protein